MTDQPVTPDREALVRCAAEALSYQCGGDHGYEDEAQIAVDALAGRFLPWFTDALDRARQQGKREGRDEAAEAIRDDGDRAEHFGGLRTSIAVYRHCEMLATGEEQPQPRLARGGPNRKDEE